MVIVGLVTWVRISLRNLSSVFNIEGTDYNSGFYLKFYEFLFFIVLCNKSGIGHKPKEYF